MTRGFVCHRSELSGHDLKCTAVAEKSKRTRLQIVQSNAKMILVAYSYLVLNKPYGVVAQFSDRAGEGHTTLAALVPIQNVYPAGRLDKDSEGLLLLTDDGAFQHRVSHPKFEHPKTYWAQVEGVPTDEALAKLHAGVPVEDYVTKPAKVRVLTSVNVPARVPPVRYRAEIPDSWIEIQLTEGRNRQVRRMCAAVGYPVLRLIRVSIGALRLGDLKSGEWRRLTESERVSLGPGPSGLRRFKNRRTTGV